MFYGLENTQPEVSEMMEKLVNENSFPKCSLFCGPKYSSRMYAAMALAKSFNADFDSTVIISDRDYGYRVSCALRLLESARNKAARIFFKQTLEVFLKQYHGALLDSASAAGRKKFSDAGDCMDMLSGLDIVADNDIPTFCSKFSKSLEALGYSKTAGVSIVQIRAIQEWICTSSLDGKQKFIIIEGLEYATSSASNCLLKTLEEPPEDTHFILLAENAGRILPTILSRVQKFVFKPFTEKEKNYVLNSLFVNPSQYKDIKTFFIVYSGVDEELLQESADSLVAGRDFGFPNLVKELEKNQCWDRFFEIVIDKLYELYKTDTIKYLSVSKLVSDIENQIKKARLYNQTKRLTLDYVVFSIQETLK